MIGYYIEIATQKDDIIVAQSKIFDTKEKAKAIGLAFDYCNNDNGNDYGIYLMRIDTDGDCEQIEIIK